MKSWGEIFDNATVREIINKVTLISEYYDNYRGDYYPHLLVREISSSSLSVQIGYSHI